MLRTYRWGIGTVAVALAAFAMAPAIAAAEEGTPPRGYDNGNEVGVTKKPIIAWGKIVA